VPQPLPANNAIQRQRKSGGATASAYEYFSNTA
jgi:hypothetical protein